MAKYHLWDICNADDFAKIKIYKLIKVYQNSGIIPTMMNCDLCKSPMYLSPNKICTDGFKWRCLNWKKYRCPKKSIRKTTVLECFRLSLSEIAAIFLLMIQGKSNVEIERRIRASYTTILRLQKCFQRVCKILVDQSQTPFSPIDVQKIKDAVQSIPNLTKENVFELHNAEFKARQVFGPLLHVIFWKTVGNLVSQI